MEIIKKFIYKYRIVLSVFAFLILSFGIYLFVTAEEDPFANQIEVKNAKVSVIDGTPNKDGNFDSNDEEGNDSSDSNGIVRNFDSVEYDISYNLDYKEDSSLDEKPTDPQRHVIVDFLLPSDITADVSEKGDSSTATAASKHENITIDGKNYNYYIFDIPDSVLTDKNTARINVSNINSKNNQTINPLIRVRESTDENYKIYTDDSDVSDSISVKEVTVTAKEAWNLKLYNGVVKGKEVGSASLPVGIAIYLPFDSNKGIFGLQVPSQISFDVNISSDLAISRVLDTPTVGNYNSDSEYVIAELPYSYDGNKNGNSGIEKVNDNTYKITIKNLMYHDKTINLGTEDKPVNVNYVSTKQLIINTERTDFTNKNNINYTISANGESITMLDNYVPFVGDYLSKVDFINSNNIQTSEITDKPVTTLPNSAFYNYNEEFYIQDTINYGLNVGDDLPNGITNYLKIDNTAIKIININNLSDESKDYYINFSDKDKNREYELNYGIGEWSSNYFKVKSDAPSYCPTNLSKLSKEELMNYYGGPCIEENSSVKWYESINEATAVNSSNSDKIILIRLNVSSTYKTGVTTTLRFKAQVKNNTNLVGNSYQVVSRGFTDWEQDGNKERFYMYESGKNVIPVNLSKQTSDMSYSKTLYDNAMYKVSKEESPKSKYGNSIIVTGLKASIDDITVLDKNNSEKNEIYSGQNDPMEIQIRPVIYKSDMNAEISGATVSVTLPTTMTVAVLKGDKKPIGNAYETTDANGKSYLTYSYSYSAEEIKKEGVSAAGTIPVLKIHAYVAINTLDNTAANIKAVITGKVKPNTNATLEIPVNTPESLRTNTKEIILRNTNDITALGSAGLNYIEANGSYGYNMKATNLVADNANLELLNILPYNGDGVGSSYGSTYSGTIGVSIYNTLPAGYEAYYTKDNPKAILNNEMKNSNSVNWTKWTNYTFVTNDVTAIKIVSSNPIQKGSYFAGETGINIVITTKGNKELDTYNNNFYMLHKNSLICKDEDANENECTSTEIGTRVYSSNVSTVSVYNRTISGYVFEDQNYDGIYSNKEPRLSDIIVQLYRTSSNVTDYKKPLEVISDSDELVEETVTNLKGAYKFKALTSGNYYVKYTFDCDKYTVTEKNKQDPTSKGDLSLVDSDADMLNDGTCSAVSNIVKLDNDIVAASNIDLGLRVRQDFDIKMNKYITNVTVTSNKGVQSYDYEKQNKVKIDVKNLKNTSFRVSYLIELENSRYFPGTIGNIIETIPEGMTFNPNLPENDGWYESEGNLYYKDLNKTMIMPGEKYYITIVLDLVTNNGGDYINFVAATDLKIKPVITNFLEIVDDDEYTIIDNEVTEDEMEEGGYDNE